MPSSWSCQSPDVRSKHDVAHKIGIEFPPCLRVLADIKDPAGRSEMIKVPLSDRDDNVKDDGYDEKVGREDELMMPEMGDHSEKDGEEERDCPEEYSVGIREEEFQSGQIVFEPFFFQPTRDFQPGFDKEDPDPTDASDISREKRMTCPTRI